MNGGIREEKGGADGGLLGAFVTRMPYTNVTNSSSLLRESGQSFHYPRIARVSSLYLAFIVLANKLDTS